MRGSVAEVRHLAAISFRIAGIQTALATAGTGRCGSDGRAMRLYYPGGDKPTKSATVAYAA
jgi:hypothetical protein